MFLGGQHGAFPGRPARDYEINPFLKLPPNQAAHGRLIELAIRLEGSDQSRATTAKLSQFHRRPLSSCVRPPEYLIFPAPAREKSGEDRLRGPRVPVRPMRNRRVAYFSDSMDPELSFPEIVAVLKGSEAGGPPRARHFMPTSRST